MQKLDFLAPRLLLFMSVDLVGSTALKQAPKFPLEEPSSIDTKSLYSPKWLSPISEFYAAFGKIFETSWLNFIGQPRIDARWPEPTSSPEFWKAAGDELIYVLECRDRRELYLCLVAWLDAVKKYRAEQRANGGLDIKATVWLAGFPITNFEIVFSRTVKPDDTQFVEDPRLRMFFLLEQWHSNAQEGLVRDFIGPSIDTGFRLSGHATPRKLVVSVDVAWLLATTPLPPRSNAREPIDTLKLRFEGAVELRGVIGGRPYPIFWLDTMAEEPLARAEDRLNGRQEPLSQEAVRDFCDAFFAANDRHLLRPFMRTEGTDMQGEIPNHYEAHVKAMRDTWEHEKKRYNNIQESRTAKSGPDKEREIAPDQAAEALAEQVLKPIIGKAQSE